MRVGVIGAQFDRLFIASQCLFVMVRFAEGASAVVDKFSIAGAKLHCFVENFQRSEVTTRSASHDSEQVKGIKTVRIGP